MKESKVYNVFIECLIVISFVMSVYANIISFYLTGNTNDTVRKGVSWSIIFAITLVLVVHTLRKWLAVDKVIKRNIILCMIPLFINGIVLVWALLDSSFNSIVLKQCVSFGAYCVPIVCGAIYMILEDKIESVVSKVKYVASVMMPFYCIAIVYFWNMTPETSLREGIGGMVYLTIGYSSLPIYALLVFDLLILFMQQYKKKWNIFLVLVEMAILSLIVIGSGSRGVLLAWLVINVVSIVIMLLKKERSALIGVLIGTLSIVLFCVFAPDNNGAIARQFAFINEIKNGSLKQSLVSEEGQELLNELFVQAEGDKGMEEVAKDIRDELANNKTDSEVSTENVENTKGTENKETIISKEEAEQDNSQEITVSDRTTTEEEKVEYENSYKDAVYSITNGSMARSYLWQLAIKEMKQDPITGMGPLGYQLKYKGYTHNILLECMADFGVIIFGIFTIFTLITMFIFIKSSLKRRETLGLLIVLSGETVRAMLSGNLYVSPFLLFAFTIAIWIQLQKTKNQN